MNFFFESLCKRVKCPTSQPGKIYCIQLSNINACLLQLSKLCTTSPFSLPYGHTYIFCSYNENRNIHRLFFQSDYEHGYLAYENTAVSPCFFPLGTFGKTFLAAKRDGCCRRLTDISLTSEYSFVSSSDETCTGPFTKLGM